MAAPTWQVAALVLNSELSTLGKRIGRTMDAVEERVNTTETMSQFLTLNRIFGVLEMVRSRYRLLRAVTWRYVSSPCSGSVPLSYFYGGLLLDEFRHILRFTSTLSGNIDFDSDYVYQISEFCTRFMNHFKEITEPQFNTDYSVSGSKITDLLHCIMDRAISTGSNQQEDRMQYQGSLQTAEDMVNLSV
ncbi:uncharacterized protein LOC111872805 isoform X2 [Cryptotermes secundus]|uniref:uncharacterized protein LOC111872805 isoform X2 n=1 Tax=Cryptotermes secundus TaxID=105785 RepID=UPI000CD7B36E|nr:uncharacterized protein LOC111872805 isoform X2 [Cryptotermes secundus]